MNAQDTTRNHPPNQRILSPSRERQWHFRFSTPGRGPRRLHIPGSNQPIPPIGQQQTLGSVEYQQSPSTRHPTPCQDFGDVEDTSMHPGGDEEEKALFKDGSQATVRVSLPYSNKTSMALLRFRPDDAGVCSHDSAMEEVVPRITYGNAEYERMEEVMMMSMGYHPPALWGRHYHHVLDRLPIDSIPPSGPSMKPKRLIWGHSPLRMVTSVDDLPRC
ncbi:hypothetical protein PG993_001799 [Apiospora rasikravindrae]|uniref:Uncharacterized protein n=1 Tax=Apiospora rasikravindrae TaxID=990691 RepID=A0ABR1UD18_9PEZI